MAKPPSWLLTAHALDRYSERVEPSIDRRDARARLTPLLAEARLLPEPSVLGDEQWELPGGGVVVGKRVGKLTVAVTCLTAGQRGTVAEVVEAARRISREVDDPRPPESRPAPPPAPVEESRATTVKALRAERNRALSDANALAARLRHAENRLTDLEEHLRRITAHAASRSIDRDAYRLALKMALRAVRFETEDRLATVLRAVAEVDPALASDEFAFPELFTAEERRAASARLRPAEDRSSAEPQPKIPA